MTVNFERLCFHLLCSNLRRQAKLSDALGTYRNLTLVCLT